MIGRLGLIMLWLRGEEGGVSFLFFKALSRFLMESWKKARALGIYASSPSERSFTRVRSVIAAL